MIWLSWLKVAFLCNFIKYFLILSEHQKGGFTFFTTLHYAPELFKIWSYDIIGKTTFSWNESQIFLLTFHECQNSGALCTVFYKNKGTKNKFQLLLPKSLILLRLHEHWSSQWFLSFLQKYALAKNYVLIVGKF